MDAGGSSRSRRKMNRIDTIFTSQEQKFFSPIIFFIPFHYRDEPVKKNVYTQS